jgi:hypothetical protein
MTAVSVKRTIGRAVSVLLASAFLAAAVQAAEPRFENVVLSDEKGGAAKKVFAPNTTKIFVDTKLADVKAGSKLKAVWIAEKTKVAPPDYQIDSTELTVGSLMNLATFSLSKPTAGWPTGDYRVELSINGKAAGTVRFSVAP